MFYCVSPAETERSILMEWQSWEKCKNRMPSKCSVTPGEASEFCSGVEGGILTTGGSFRWLLITWRKVKEDSGSKWKGAQSKVYLLYNFDDGRSQVGRSYYNYKLYDVWKHIAFNMKNTILCKGYVGLLHDMVNQIL